MDDQNSSSIAAWLAPLIGFLLIGLIAGIWWLARSARISTAGTHQTSSTAPSTINSGAIENVNASTTQHATGIVYEADFSQEPVDEWSQTNVWIASNDTSDPFLGPIKEKPLTFTVGNLPPHQFIRLTFKLMTYQPWNGDSRYAGRDLWDMRVVGGQPLIHTTFSNCGYFLDDNEQSFPDQYPWYPTHPGWTGAAAFQTLGFKYKYKTYGNGTTGYAEYGTDSTYAFDLTFPHSGDTLQLQFKTLLRHNEFKPYGFLSFQVQTVDRAAVADDKTLAKWWDDLGGEDSVKAFHAVWAMIATGDTATRYIKANLPPVSPDDPYPVNISPNTYWQPDCFILDTPAARRQPRAIHVLEVIHSADSMAMLKTMGYPGTPQGAPPDRWTVLPREQLLKNAKEDIDSKDPKRIAAVQQQMRDLILTERVGYAIDFLLDAKQFGEVDSICRSAMINSMYIPFWISKCQRSRALALLGLGKNDEALAAAKAYYNVALMSQTDDAINLVAQCLEKARPDGKELAERFKRQQSAWADPGYSPTTRPASGDAELGDPILPTIKIDPNPFNNFANAYAPDQYGIYVAKGNLLLLSDRAADARAAFEQSLSVAKGKQTVAAAQNIARAIRAQNGCMGPASAYLLSAPDSRDGTN